MRLTTPLQAGHLRAMPVHLRVEGESAGVAQAAALMRKFAARMLAVLALQDAELSLMLCNDRVMRRLNRAHRQIDRPTDVLAFAMREGPAIVSMQESLGDVVISWPTTKRQARAHGQAAERELCLLLAHGLLHLLGFDHANKVDERRMMARAHMLMAAGLRRGSKGGQARASGSQGATATHVRHISTPENLELLP